MTMARPQHIVLGITGGIAAYKSLFLIRMFKKANYDVKVIATGNALEFVTRLTIETLSQNELYYDPFAPVGHREIEHIALADWADAVVVAPASANIIGKYAGGIADDALSTFLLAVNKPVFMAPAMNHNMYEHTAVQENLAKLRARGCHIIGPQGGFLACGTEGQGRMEEPDRIFRIVSEHFENSNAFKDKKVLITAGPTYEAIDPVRYIGNHSSGLMGFELAGSFARQGAEVTLITGPTNLHTNDNRINRVDVVSAMEMREAVNRFFGQSDIVVMAAAVADYTPRNTADQKIKKKEDTWMLELEKTIDILAEIGQRKESGQYIVGFALETDHEMENAKSKLQNKNLDLIVLNSMKIPGAGFKSETNQVTMIARDGDTVEISLKSKKDVAGEITEYIGRRISK